MRKGEGESGRERVGTERMSSANAVIRGKVFVGWVGQDKLGRVEGALKKRCRYHRGLADDEARKQGMSELKLSAGIGGERMYGYTSYLPNLGTSQVRIYARGIA